MPTLSDIEGDMVNVIPPLLSKLVGDKLKGNDQAITAETKSYTLEEAFSATDAGMVYLSWIHLGNFKNTRYGISVSRQNLEKMATVLSEIRKKFGICKYFKTCGNETEPTECTKKKCGCQKSKEWHMKLLRTTGEIVDKCLDDKKYLEKLNKKIAHFNISKAFRIIGYLGQTTKKFRMRYKSDVFPFFARFLIISLNSHLNISNIDLTEGDVLSIIGKIRVIQLVDTSETGPNNSLVEILESEKLDQGVFKDLQSILVETYPQFEFVFLNIMTQNNETSAEVDELTEDLGEIKI